MKIRLAVLLSIVISLTAIAAETLPASPAPPAPPASAAAPASKPTLDQAALEKLGWHLASQAYTFRKITLLETLDTLSSLGVRYIEIYPGQQFSPETKDTKFDHNVSSELFDQFVAKCKATNITPVNYGVVGLPNDEAECRKVFDFAKKLGLQTIVSEPRADALELIDKLAIEYQINVAIHNHPQPSIYWNPDAVLKACEGRSARIGACADVGHWARSGLVPAECLKKLEGHVISFHLKDIDDKKEDVVWGSGKVDMAAVLAEAKRQGIHPVMSIEYERTEGAELVANVTKCIEYFNSQIIELSKGTP
jgi:sugar phosphate isomerase/epimerase